MQTPTGRSAATYLLILAISPPDAAAQLVQSSSGFAFARVFENQAGVTLMPEPDSLGVALGATAADVVDLPDEQYLVDFSYEASMLGGGSVTWGSANGNLSVDASSTPQFAPPAPGGPPQPLANSDNAQAGGTVDFRFNEIGTVTSQTLAAGTPITIDLNCRVDSSGVVSGTLEAPNETRVGAGAECRVINNSGGFVGTELLVSNNEIETKAFAAAVGHELAIEGVFRVVGEAYAGAVLCCAEYLGDASAVIAGSGGLWLEMPAGVTLTTPSGHDYTVPVPEPRTTLPVALAALALLRLRFAQRTNAPSGGNRGISAAKCFGGASRIWAARAGSSASQRAESA